MFDNHAVWLPSKGASLKYGPAPYTAPASNEIVVQNRAVAVNPLDWLLQSVGDIIYPWLRYPFVLGSDVAGEVVQVGVAVTRFKVGDRVLGHAVGSDKNRNNSAEGGFQLYTVVLAHMACPIPPSMAFESAVVLPLGLSTAASALFQNDLLALQPPTAAIAKTGKVVLIWGGSTSVGNNAIQLAAAAGYEVIATASPKNFAHLRSLGASEVIDYRSKSAVPDITTVIAGREFVGAVAIGSGAAGACIEIAARCHGKRFVAIATPQMSMDGIMAVRGNRLRFLLAMINFIAATILVTIKAKWRGVSTKFIFGTSLKENQVSHLIYEDFLPAALAEGRYLALPEPLVAGSGLESIQAAVALHRNGVSARKVVVTL